MTTSLITGANKGLGKEIARQLVAAGHTVYLGARDAGIAKRRRDGHGEALDGPSALEVFDTNAVGIIRVTEAALPLLRRSDNPVVVNVSSARSSPASRRPSSAAVTRAVTPAGRLTSAHRSS